MYKKLIQITLLVMVYAVMVNAKLIEGISAEAVVAISGKSAEEAEQLALRRARAAALEKANGVQITATTLVKDGRLAIDFLKAYTSGIIVKEEKEWLPPTFYQKDKDSAPIPQYHLKIKADIEIVEKETDLTLNASLNREIFRENDLSHITVETSDESVVAIFYMGADDKIYKLVPDKIFNAIKVKKGEPLVFPAKDSKMEFKMQVLPQRQSVEEAFWIIASKQSENIDFNKIFLKDEYTLHDFFNSYAKIASKCSEAILPYQVVKQNLRQ